MDEEMESVSMNSDEVALQAREKKVGSIEIYNKVGCALHRRSCWIPCKA